MQSSSTRVEESSITELLRAPPLLLEEESFSVQQRADPEVLGILQFLEKEELSAEEKHALKLALQR